MDPSQNNIIPQNGNTATIETNILDNFKRKCKYVVAKFNSKIETKEFEIPGDQNSKCVFDVKMENTDYAKIGAEFTRNMLDANVHKVSFERPSLSSTCTIPLSKEENYEREFGYIQTSKMLFYEREYENAIMFSDFHANLLHGQDEVLDSDGENNPFYSTDSYFKVPAGKKPPHSIELRLIDNPKSETRKIYGLTSKTSSNNNWGCLVKHEMHQQFFVYLVMRSKQNNEDKWKYEVFYSFDWFIYLKWVKSIDKNDIFEYNSGLNEHLEPFRTLPEWNDSEERYTCNQDRFYYSVDKTNVQFNIVHYPESIYKHKLKGIYKNIKKIIKNMNKEFENIKLNISNAKKLCENIEKIEDLEENVVHIESMNLEGNKVSENLFECIRKIDRIKSKEYSEKIPRLSRTVERICNYVKRNEIEKNEFPEKFRNIAEGVKDLYNRIEKINWVKIEVRKSSESIDLGNNENCESSESISSEVNKLHNCIQVMNSIEDQFYKGVDGLILRLDKLYEEFERRDNKDEIKFLENYQSVTLELRTLYKFIENRDLKKIKFRTIHETINSHKIQLLDDIEVLNAGKQVYEILQSLQPKVNTLCEDIKKMEREENEFIKNCRSIDEEKLSMVHEIDEFRKNYVKNMRTYIANLILNENQVFEDIDDLFPEIKTLNEDVEKLNLGNTDGFCKIFLYLALEVKKLWACIEMMDLKTAHNRKSCFKLGVEKILPCIDNISFEDIKNDRWLRKIEELCLAKRKEFENSKFCDCNNSEKTDLRNEFQKKIKERNEKEKYE